GRRAGRGRAPRFPYAPRCRSASGQLRVLRAMPQRAVSKDVSIIGHGVERKTLEAGWRRVLGGETQSLAITGEAGIGKSTLLRQLDRKSTRLNSSHVKSSYAVL